MKIRHMNVVMLLVCMIFGIAVMNLEAEQMMLPEFRLSIAQEPQTVQAEETEQSEKAAPAVQAAPEMPSAAPENLPWSYRDFGTCRNLREDASLVVIFLEDDQSDWTAWEMQNYLDTMIDPAVDYIEDAARWFGWNTELEYIWYVDDNSNPDSTDYNGHVASLESNYYDNYLLANSADALDFASVEDMLWDDRRFSGNDQIGYLFVLDKPGRSYQWGEWCGDEYVEFAVLYTSQNGYRERPYMVAHETMHLFGAEDMYTEGGRYVNRSRLAQQLHPHELFLTYEWDLQNSEIGLFTAYTVGWVDTLPDVYLSPEWWS